MNVVQNELLLALRDSRVQQFIVDHEMDDAAELVLRTPTIFNLPSTFIANQISGRQKAKKKLPSFYNTPGIIYPRGLNLEQSSSELSAKFKARAMSEDLEQCTSLLDLTGGFGVDSFFFSQVFGQVSYVEPDEELAFIAKLNHETLGARNILHKADRAEAILQADCSGQFDLLYIDPSRRVESQKVYRLEQCDPNVVALQPLIFNLSSSVLIKASPLLDITQSLQSLSGITKIFVISVDHECRELLLLCKKKSEAEPEIIAVHLNKGKKEAFQFRLSEERNCVVEYSSPLAYLYEPNPSILKAGAFKLGARRFNLKKLHPNTQLYTSEALISDFPGRVFENVMPCKSDPKEIAAILPERKANVFTRNYPVEVSALRKKMKIQEGGTKFLIATTSVEGKLILLANRVL